jgi:5-methylcytosine-specific restriction endonuclease McrA
MGLYRTAAKERRVTTAMFWRYELIDILRRRDGDECGICHLGMTFGTSTGPLGSDDSGATVDHVLFRSAGGSDDLSNLRLAHWSCNRARGNREDADSIAARQLVDA